MIVQCDECSAKFKLDDSKVTEQGVRVRCSKCSHVFVVKKDAAADEPDLDNLLSGLVGAKSQPDAPPAEQEPAFPGYAPSPPSLPDSSADSGFSADDLDLSFDHEQNAGNLSGGPKEDFSFDEDVDLDAGAGGYPLSEGESAAVAGGGSAEEGYNEFSFGEGESSDFAFDMADKEPEASGGPSHADDEISFDESTGGSFDFTTPAPPAEASPQNDGFSFEEDTFGAEEFLIQKEEEAPASSASAAGFDFDFSQDAAPAAAAKEPVEGDDDFSFFPEPAVAPTATAAKKAAPEAEEFDLGFGGTDDGDSASSESVNEAGAEDDFGPLDFGHKEKEAVPASFPPAAAAAASASTFSFGDPVAEESDEEPPPLVIGSRRRGGESSMAGKLLAGLLVVVLGGGGYYVYSHPKMLEMVGLGGVLQAVWPDKGTISIPRVDGAFHTNAEMGEIFVVQGEVASGRRSPSLVHVRAKILGPGGKVLMEKMIAAGPTLSANALATLPAQRIDATLKNASGPLKPGERAPFMAVFRDVPKEAVDFAAEAIYSAGE